jgi:rubrerythrin
MRTLKEIICQALCGVWRRTWPDNVDIFATEMNASVHTLLEMEHMVGVEDRDKDMDETIGDADEHRQDAIDEDEEDEDDDMDDHLDHIENPLSETELSAFDAMLGEVTALSEQRTGDVAVSMPASDPDGDIEMNTDDTLPVSTSNKRARKEADEAMTLIENIINEEHAFDLAPILKGRGAQDVRRRLDYLFLLDVRLWKEARLHFHELLIVNMMHNQRYKLTMSKSEGWWRCTFHDDHHITNKCVSRCHVCTVLCLSY